MLVQCAGWQPMIRIAVDSCMCVQGIVAAVAATELTIPLIVRLEGTNVEAGLKVGNSRRCGA